MSSSTASNSLPTIDESTPGIVRPRRDFAPLLLVPILTLLALPLVGDVSTWLTLSLAGLAMGMVIFIIASGLTLIFGLMDVMNFAHGAFIANGAFIASMFVAPLLAWSESDSVWLNFAVLAIAILGAMAVTGLLGVLFERLIIRPVYGQHLKQILITMGGMIVAEQLLTMIWGAEQIPFPLPNVLRGSLIFGDALIEKYRLFAVVIGLVILLSMLFVLNRTKLGLLIRAGVENPEMVESLGYRIKRLFILVFAAGSACAGLGGVMWGLYKETVSTSMSAELMVTVFIVVIIGGMGSVGGCFIASLLLALTANYAGFLAPKFALISHILVMIMVLLWRPAGLFALGRR
ncbi:branched-chain amino acid ABC transporter permease [Undibacterium cyanobacteriorum]|uniref:Branched-chain amino acid ABC transporter permease n=1 Tax=Undibacterium cyanobacteriorum TaxID=3073561 RepID=A0ABY9RHQ1_9BURK|nr:branched-chain amino acid ABC transporter permease [Undibacterium sp. 20NA77.5]WMW79827.1 branched-chain amino acid ABC transporter permease [Undibacterium sp. 20NA77.5]